MEYMARALNLAARALGTSSPNPAVGAVLVKHGGVVGEGFTRPAGQAHAEIVALEQAGSAARGATLYVTLEPCPHHGRTPPCVDALVEAGVVEVQMATLDPSPWVDGAGRTALESAGIRTGVGMLEREARHLNEGYLTWVTAGRPFVTVVYAMSLDGAVAQHGTDPRGEPARAELERLRTRADRALAGLDGLLGRDPALAQLADAGVTSLFVECDAGDLAQLVGAGLADKLVAFITPRVLGSGGGVPTTRVDGASARATPLRDLTYERLGDDLMAVGYTQRCSPAS